jgi:hypothetical protein
MPWKVRLMERTDRFAVSLRRFTFSSSGRVSPECPHGHDASTPSIEVRERHGTNLEGCIAATIDHMDSRWPTHCQKCGYEFLPDDQWQENESRLHRFPDTGEELTARQAPVGAAWFMPWRRESGFVSQEYRRDWEGKREPIVVKLAPGGPSDDWCIDGCASNAPDGHGWVVTGTLEGGDLTASPSIAAGGYHGWLRGGLLTEDCEGRTFPGIPRTA